MKDSDRTGRPASNLYSSPILTGKVAKRIELHSKKLVKDFLAGLYLSVFKGRGMEFDALREYTPGDEIRHIDWNASARMNRPYVKQFIEERELTLLLVADVSSSMLYGSGVQSKQELMAEVGALIALSAVENRDRVGLLRFAEDFMHFLPPGRGVTHALQIASELLAPIPKGRKSSYGAMLNFLYSVQKRHCLCFFLSDFLDLESAAPFAMAARRYDSIALCLSDQREQQLPSLNILNLRPLEGGGGGRKAVDTADPRVRKSWATHLGTRRKRCREGFAKLGIDWVELKTGEKPIDQLVRFFSERKRVWSP